MRHLIVVILFHAPHFDGSGFRKVSGLSAPSKVVTITFQHWQEYPRYFAQILHSLNLARCSAGNHMQISVLSPLLARVSLRPLPRALHKYGLHRNTRRSKGQSNEKYIIGFASEYGCGLRWLWIGSRRCKDTRRSTDADTSTQRHNVYTSDAYPNTVGAQCECG